VTMARSEGASGGPLYTPRFLKRKGAIKTSEGARHTLAYM